NEATMRREAPWPVVECGAALLRKAVAYGTTALRSHVDVDAEVKLANVEAILTLKNRWTGIVDIQTVAFPQGGILRTPVVRSLLEEAIALGCDVVGGIDPIAIDGDVDGHLDVVFGIAQRHGAGIDLHLHDVGEAGLAQLLAIVERT